MKSAISMIVPYYNQPRMLEQQLASWAAYTVDTLCAIEFIIVDDGSAIPAEPIVRAMTELHGNCLPDPQLYRIDKDIPWNRAGARNLGSMVAETEWLMHIDTDHVLLCDDAQALVGRMNDYNKKSWYRFRRFRVGAADETRRKDKIPDHVEFGEIKPHIDSYICTRNVYNAAGGYNEDFSGCLGGGSPFLRELEKVAGPAKLLPPDTCLRVHTRHSIPDASADLDRDRGEYKRRSAALTKAGKIKGHDPLRFPWHRVF